MVTWAPEDTTFQHDASSWTAATHKQLKLAVGAAGAAAGERQTCAVETGFGVQIGAASLAANQPRSQSGTSTADTAATASGRPTGCRSG